MIVVVVSGKVRKGFFFVKKKQKTFLNWATGGETGTGQNERSFFCFFFVHKKEDSSLSISGPLPSDGPMQTVIDHTDRYYQPAVPGAPLNGPIRLAVIQPP